MSRPATTWAAILGGLLAYDVLCDRRKDDSTLSCVTRAAVAAVPGGEFIFTAGLVAGAWWFHDHIIGPLTRTPLDL